MNLPSRKVLLIRLSSMGDVVLASSAIAPLRAAGYEISLVTKKEFASLWEKHPDVAEIYSFDKNSGGEEAARKEFYAWAEKQGFAFAVDLQNSWRTWSWRRYLRRFFPVCVAQKPRGKEILVLFLRLGEWLGFRPGERALLFRLAAEDALAKRGEFTLAEGPLTRLRVTEEEKTAVAPLLPSGPFVVLLPASAWKSKEWPYFPELAAIFARKAPVVVLGGKKDEICALVAAKAMAVNPASRSLHGRTSLRESMAILAQARWVVGCDTGMVHVAEALGRDVAMLEGPTHPYMGFSPYRPQSEVIGLSLLCRPCSKSGRICLRFGQRVCLKGLKVADVASRLRHKGYPC